MQAFVLTVHLWQVIHKPVPTMGWCKSKVRSAGRNNHLVSAWKNRHIGTHKPFLRPEQRFLFRFDKKPTYPLNLSGFHASQCLQCCQAVLWQLSGTAGSWRGTSHPRGCLHAVPPASLTWCSLLQPADPCQGLLWCPIRNQGCLEQLFLGKYAFVLLDMLHRDVAGTSMASSRLLSPWFPPHAWAYTLVLLSFPGWKWSRGAGRLKGLTKLVAIPLLGPGPIC